MGTYNYMGIYNRRPVFAKPAANPDFWHRFDWVFYDERYGWVVGFWYLGQHYFTLYTKHTGVCPISPLGWYFLYAGDGTWYYDQTVTVECINKD